jgi:flagellar biosynthesis component FlhA
MLKWGLSGSLQAFPLVPIQASLIPKFSWSSKSGINPPVPVLPSLFVSITSLLASWSPAQKKIKKKTIQKPTQKKSKKPSKHQKQSNYGQSRIVDLVHLYQNKNKNKNKKKTKKKEWPALRPFVSTIKK